MPDTDRCQAIRRRRRQLRFLKHFEEFLGLRRTNIGDLGTAGQPDCFTHAARGGRAHAAEAILKELKERAALLSGLVILEHLQQDSQLDPLRVRLDFLGFTGQFMNATRKDNDAVGLGSDLGNSGSACFGCRQHIRFIILGHPCRRHKDDACVRIGDSGEFKKLVHRTTPALVLTVKLNAHRRTSWEFRCSQKSTLLSQRACSRAQLAQTIRREVLDLFVKGHFGAVGLGVHRQLDVVGRLTSLRLGEDCHRPTSGDQPVHARGADTDALLTAAHF